jgi:MoaA/NifB/PqqE/SkfB family radical SAM enzyme
VYQNRFKHLFFGVNYIAKYWIAGKANPLICGLVLHNKCNLRCLHCDVINRPVASMSFNEATGVIDDFYSKGGRCLYLEGGEPFIWHGNSYCMEDIVRYAKKRGYLTVIIYTNGTHKIESEADTIFISVDGLQKTHDKLRGKSFDKIFNNILLSSHPSLFLNFTINSVNRDEIEDLCEFIASIKQIKGIFFYFHNPYYGYDDLFIDSAAKNEILNRLLILKRRYSILNSTAGLKSALRNDWKKNLDICTVYEDGHYYRCCRINNNETLCKKCGYLSYAEIEQTLKLKPSAILNALKYF